MVDIGVLEDVASERRRRHQQQLENRRSGVTSAIAALERYALPVLEQAGSAFANRGIEVRITKNFDVAEYLCKDPSIEWRCFGPKRQSDGWQFEGIAVFCSSWDGTSIAIGIGAHSFDKSPKHHLGDLGPRDCRPILEEAIERALDRYFQELSQLKELGAFQR